MLQMLAPTILQNASTALLLPMSQVQQQVAASKQTFTSLHMSSVKNGHIAHVCPVQVSITMIATGFGSGVIEASLRPRARQNPQQQQQQQQPPAPSRPAHIER